LNGKAGRKIIPAFRQATNPTGINESSLRDVAEAGQQWENVQTFLRKDAPIASLALVNAFIKSSMPFSDNLQDFMGQPSIGGSMINAGLRLRWRAQQDKADAAGKTYTPAPFEYDEKQMEQLSKLGEKLNQIREKSYSDEQKITSLENKRIMVSGRESTDAIEELQKSGELSQIDYEIGQVRRSMAKKAGKGGGLSWGQTSNLASYGNTIFVGGPNRQEDIAKDQLDELKEINQNTKPDNGTEATYLP
jgi:hypothetical protein